MSFLFFSFFYSWSGILSNTQNLLLTLYLGLTPGGVQGMIYSIEDWTKLVSCKVSPVSTVLSFDHLLKVFNEKIETRILDGSQECVVHDYPWSLLQTFLSPDSLNTSPMQSWWARQKAGSNILSLTTFYPLSLPINPPATERKNNRNHSRNQQDQNVK